MLARSGRDEPLGEAVIAGLEIGSIVGIGTVVPPKARAPMLSIWMTFLDRGLALRKCVRTCRDGQQECGRQQKRIVRHHYPPLS